jgi:tRNA (guanosine-2'-O-)-methyltransferase
MRPERAERLREVALRRQVGFTVLLENVHDQHNVGAVMRTCDAVGIFEIYVLQTEPGLQYKNFNLGRRTTAGARRWVDLHYYTDTELCFRNIRQRYDRVYATHLNASAVSLYSLDLTERVCLVFGNEHTGITADVLAHCDANFIIPMQGMTQSLNISVACAVTLYEGMRQRIAKGRYETAADQVPELEKLHAEYVRRHESKHSPEQVAPRRRTKGDSRK